MCELTYQRIHELLAYDPETGVFTWRVAFTRVIPGQRAGYMNSGTGYRMISVDGRMYTEHRLAFLWMTGAWPSEEVDHINRRRDDNRWENLRPASRLLNSLNMGRRRDNTSGVPGVTWNKAKKAWDARGNADGATFRLGRFKSKEDAVNARLAWLKRIQEAA